MKKILTASLVAMMAVTAARADIASTKYVDDADKVITDTIGTVETGKTVVQMISEAVTGGSTGALTDAKAYTDEKVGAEATARGEAIEAASAATKTAYEAADAALKSAYEAADATLTQGVADNTAAITAEVTRATEAEADLQSAIDAINNADTGTLATMKSELEGKITAEATARGEAIEAASAATKTAYEAADAALKSAYEAADATLTQGVEANAQAIADMGTAYKAADTTLSGRIDALETTTGENGDTTKAIEAAQAAADAAQGEVDALEGVVAGKQPKSEKLSLGAADGAWVDLTSATANYQTTGTYSLTLVNGTPYWTEVK